MSEVHDDMTASWLELSERVDKRSNNIDKLQNYISIDEYLVKEADKGSRLKDNNQLADANVLVIGEEGAGKTSLINLCLGHKEKPTPTVAPDFRFAQKDDVKVNIWEIGHIVHEEIAAIPLMEKDGKRIIVVIVLDLSKPENVTTALIQWFSFLQLAIKPKRSCIKQNSTSEFVTSCNKIEEIPFPVIIVGSKYDKFKNEESFKRKIVSTALRYFSYATNSCLIFASTKDKRASDNFKRFTRKCFFSNTCTWNKDSNWIDDMVGNENTLPNQNTLHNNGPLIVYPNPKRNKESSRHNIGDSLEDIISSLPNQITSINSIIDKNELFQMSNNSGCKVLDKWKSLFTSIFGKNTFQINNEKRASEMKEKLQLYPHDEIDILISEAYDEIDHLRRQMAIQEKDDGISS